MSFEIFTKRLSLHDFTLEDISSYVSLYTNESYTQFYSVQDSDLQFQERLAHSFFESARLTPRKSYSLAIKSRHKNNFLGVISLRLQEKNSATIGCGISSNHQGQGYAFEAMTGILDFGFNSLNIETVIAETILENKSAINLCKRLHFYRIEGGELVRIRGRLLFSLNIGFALFLERGACLSSW